MSVSFRDENKEIQDLDAHQVQELLAKAGIDKNCTIGDSLNILLDGLAIPWQGTVPK